MLTHFLTYIKKLEIASGIEIKDFDSLLVAIRARHNFFHSRGCRVSDHGIETAYAEDYTELEIQSIFKKLHKGKNLERAEILKFKSAMLYEFGVMDSEKGWVQQFHLGRTSE